MPTSVKTGEALAVDVSCSDDSLVVVLDDGRLEVEIEQLVDDLAGQGFGRPFGVRGHENRRRGSH